MVRLLVFRGTKQEHNEPVAHDKRKLQLRTDSFEHSGSGVSSVGRARSGSHLPADDRLLLNDEAFKKPGMPEIDVNLAF